MRESGQNRTKADTKTEQTVAALLSSTTLQDAADQMGVNERTLRRWLAEDAALRQEYHAAKRQLMAHTLSRMQKITTAAVSKLETILEDPEVKDAVAVGAAKVVLELALKAVVFEDLDARITTIEQQLRKRKDAER